jgi:DNA polymerase-1
MITLDFESEAIAPRPDYPPQPVGLAIKNGIKEGVYIDFGHPDENKWSEQEAKFHAEACLTTGDDLLFHNANFDCSILEEKWGLTVPWGRVHDTMVMAFLLDPHGELSLKPLAEQHLSMPPEERDAVADWLVAHKVCTVKQAGAHISKAPANIVAPYAIGDVDRTYSLYQKFQLEFVDDPRLQEAYAREMALMPHIMAMEREGVRIDVERLGKDLAFYQLQLAVLDKQIQEVLGPVDIDSGDELAKALDAKGLADNGFLLTPKGNKSVNKASVIHAISDNELLGHILLRRAIATSIRTFLSPWYEASKVSGRLFVRWNQVRNYSDTGARTGRISSSPNMQAIPVEWEGLLAEFAKIGYTPDFPLPHVRTYIIPDEGNIFIGRDYSAQELRLLAHFAGGKLLAKLQAEPESDIHMLAADIAQITRKVAKTLGFAVLYGAGVAKIASSLGITEAKAQVIKARYLAALPEIDSLQRDLKWRGNSGGFLRTLGGRKYYAEKPAVRNGQLRTFSYKLTNYLIQGSAADQTKQAMLYYATHTKHGRLTLSVHDEIVIQCPIQYQDEEAALLEHAMNTSFQDVLEYQIISTESRGFSFGEL